MLSDDAIDDGTRLVKIFLFTLALKERTDVGSAFHSVAILERKKQSASILSKLLK